MLGSQAALLAAGDTAAALGGVNALLNVMNKQQLPADADATLREGAVALLAAATATLTDDPLALSAAAGGVQQACGRSVLYSLLPILYTFRPYSLPNKQRRALRAVNRSQSGQSYAFYTFIFNLYRSQSYLTIPRTATHSMPTVQLRRPSPPSAALLRPLKL